MSEQVPYQELPEIVREAIDAEIEPWLADKPADIAAAWRDKFTRPGLTRVVAEVFRRRKGKPDTRTLDVHVQALHSSGAWLPAFTVRLRGPAVQELVRALAVVPDTPEALT